MKICKRCYTEQPLENFPKDRKMKGGKSNSCKICHRIRSAEHYRENKAKYIDRSRKAYDIHIASFKQYKENLKCRDCDETHPACLDFHHVDSSTKEKTVAEMVIRRYSKEDIQKEINKCIVLCSNCHRKLHWREKQALGE